MNIENSALKKVIGAYFMALTIMMYYFLNSTLEFGLSITYRHLFALFIIFSGILYFLARPNLARASVAVKSALVVSVPMFVMVTASMLVWVVEKSETHVITRGISYYFIFMNFFHAALAGAVLLYVFGEKGMWYNLVAIVIANLLMIAAVMKKNGVGAYISEFITLVKTFAGDTGSVIMQAEVHELAFCLGTYILYMLLYVRKDIFSLVVFSLAAFCFVSAFKRIAVVAIAVSLAFGWAMKFLKAHGREKLAVRIIAVTMVLTVVVLLGYVGMVKSGVFQKMEDAGIDTSGRANIYRAVDRFYEFSPTFIGNGMGFLTFRLNSGLDIGVGAIHNDFLDYFINIGFWGFIFWLLAFTVLRTAYFGRDGFTDGAIVTASLVLYIMIVSATDNTMNYQLFNTAVAVVTIGHGFDARVASERERIFGKYVPKEEMEDFKREKPNFI